MDTFEIFFKTCTVITFIEYWCFVKVRPLKIVSITSCKFNVIIKYVKILYISNMQKKISFHSIVYNSNALKIYFKKNF